MINIILGRDTTDCKVVQRVARILPLPTQKLSRTEKVFCAPKALSKRNKNTRKHIKTKFVHNLQCLGTQL